MLEFNQKAKLTAIPVGKGNQDEAPVCVTLRLKFDSAPKDPVAYLLGCKPEALAGIFDKDGDFILPGAEEIKASVTIEDQGRIKVLGFESEVAKISAITIKPHAINSYGLAMSVQIQKPPKHALDNLAEHLHSLVDVKFITDDRQLPLVDAN